MLLCPLPLLLLVAIVQDIVIWLIVTSFHLSLLWQSLQPSMLLPLAATTTELLLCEEEEIEFDDGGVDHGLHFLLLHYHMVPE